MWSERGRNFCGGQFKFGRFKISVEVGFGGETKAGKII
jgi:hypothetical protein